ncbi:protein FAM183A [Silurus meridionalis]|nr:protein FAM183A [Silurus meridionalis]
MAKPSKAIEKEPVDMVHQNAFLMETIRKEQQHQKLYTEFKINPFKKLHVIPDKPTARKTQEEDEADPAFQDIIRKALSEPSKKYTRPMTEAQEIGWIYTPLNTSITSPSFLHPSCPTSTTRLALKSSCHKLLAVIK